MATLEQALLLNLGSGLSFGGEWCDALEKAAPKVIPETLILDGRNIGAIRVLYPEGSIAELTAAVNDLVRSADQRLHEGPWTVTDKKPTDPGVDPAAYRSLPKYWWPNQFGAWERRDGEVNPQCYAPKFDLLRLNTFSEAVFELALAAALTGEKKYHSRAIKLLQVWFVNAETRMTPHMENAQKIPDKPGHHWTGIIEGRRFIYLTEAIHLLAYAAPLPAGLDQTLRSWFKAFLEWLQTSEMGKSAAAAKNNIGLWYDLTCIATANFIGDASTARKILKTKSSSRFTAQVALDGALEAELHRAKPTEYVVFALTALAGLAAAGERLGIELWNQSEADEPTFRLAHDWFLADPESLELAMGLQARDATSFAAAAGRLPGLLAKACQRQCRQGMNLKTQLNQSARSEADATLAQMRVLAANLEASNALEKQRVDDLTAHFRTVKASFSWKCVQAWNFVFSIFGKPPVRPHMHSKG